MYWDRIEINWNQFRNIVKEHWGQLTDEQVNMIMGKRDRFDKILIQAKIPPDRAGKLGNFNGVRQTGAVIIPFKNNKDLRFVFKLSKGLAVNDPIAVPLIGGTPRMVVFLMKTADGVARFEAIKNDMRRPLEE